MGPNEDWAERRRPGRPRRPRNPHRFQAKYPDQRFKHCSFCKRFFDRDSASRHFHKDKTSADGLQRICINCRKAYDARRYQRKKRMYISSYMKLGKRPM